MDAPKILLFDLGGVLIDFSGIRDFVSAIAGSHDGGGNPSKVGYLSPNLKAFKTGQISADQFSLRFVEEWDIVVNPNVFIAEFSLWTRGFLPGAQELLAALKRRFRLACLKATRTPRTGRECRGSRNFSTYLKRPCLHTNFGSHKPDPAIFNKALSLLGAEPEDTVFFDDAVVNVLAAQQLGIRAFQVCGISELRSCICELGFL